MLVREALKAEGIANAHGLGRQEWCSKSSREAEDYSWEDERGEWEEIVGRSIEPVS